jgi:DUF1365 family protein
MTTVLDHALVGVVTPTVYDTVITHQRLAPIANRFTYTSRSWLVDLDQLPTLPRGLRWLGRFDPRDHLGSSDSSLRDNVASYLADHGIDVTGGTLLMLANSRAFGRAFNPISIHWAYSPAGALVAVIAEVHNTYGDRHAYLLLPDADGQVVADLDKEMYVSPFNPVDGRYRISVSAPDARVSVSVRLDRDGQPAFVATLTGKERGPRGPVRSALGTAAVSTRVSALIRWQGIRLYFRGLKVQPRPQHHPQKGVSR